MAFKFPFWGKGVRNLHQGSNVSGEGKKFQRRQRIASTSVRKQAYVSLSTHYRIPYDIFVGCLDDYVTDYPSVECKFVTDRSSFF